MNTRIRLPVVRSLKIEDYPMFPGSGSNGKGFEHKFQSGLNVIVGVNGLGKTTLLNILFRMLVGPYDPRKSDLLEPGSKLHALTELKRFNYFALRIGTDARNARVTLDLAFENDVLHIVRNLGPSLEVLELRHNKTILEAPDEQRYLEKIRELSRIESAYDWVVVFKDERRPPNETLAKIRKCRGVSIDRQGTVKLRKNKSIKSSQGQTPLKGVL